MSFFSVIVPIYKIPDEYLKKCIDSILNQSFKDYEIILVDDESPDNCGQICDEYSKRFKNIKVIHQSNQGVSVARNNGVKNSNGKWIIFVDGDDWVEENYLESFYQMINDEEADIYISSCFVNYPNSQVVNSFFKDDELVFSDINKDRAILQFLCNKIYEDNLGTADVGAPWAKAYSRKFLFDKKLLFNPELLRMQDNIFNLYAFQYAKKIVYKNKPLYHYRKSKFSGFNRYNPNIIKYYEKVFTIIQNFIEEFNKDKIFQEALKIKIINSFYVYLKLYYYHCDNKESFYEVNKKIKCKLKEKMYKNALESFNYNYMNNKEKIFSQCLKMNFTIGLIILLKGKELFYLMLRRNIK